MLSSPPCQKPFLSLMHTISPKLLLPWCWCLGTKDNNLQSRILLFPPLLIFTLTHNHHHHQHRLQPYSRKMLSSSGPFSPFYQLFFSVLYARQTMTMMWAETLISFVGFYCVVSGIIFFSVCINLSIANKSKLYHSRPVQSVMFPL